MTPSKIFLYFCLSFIGGIFISSMLGILPSNREVLLLLGLILGLIFISVLWQYKKLVIVGFCLLFFAVGIWRYQIAELKIENNELRKSNDLNQEITLIGIISTEPDIREKTQKLTLKIENLTENGSLRATETRSLRTSGKVLITTNRYPEYQYGDRLKITGKLESPPDLEGFNYRGYLQKEGIYSIMSWPKIELIEQGFGNSVTGVLFSFKNKFRETAQSFISPPEVGFLEALVFGEEGNIPKEWKDKLNFTGTRHVTAVSGMNITIISSLILSFAISLGLWRHQALRLSMSLIWLYILMIGAPASALRAGIMATLLMIGQYCGRLSSVSRAVIFAAFFMLLLNPLLLRFDVGFQLSFLAIFGMIYFQSFFSNLLKIIPDLKALPLKTTLSITLAAQVFTLPILIYNFGYVSLISPIANALIVPFLAPITILIFVFGLTGMISGFFGFILSLPVWLSLTYIVKTIDWFSELSWASLALKNIHWIWLIVYYLIMGIIIRRLEEKQKLKFLNY